MLVLLSPHGVIVKYVREGFLAFVQEAVCPLLEDIINPKK